MKATWKIRLLLRAYDAQDGIPVPPMDIFQKLELRDLWKAGILGLRGDFVEGHGTLYITDRGRRFVDAHRVDWPVSELST